jgi:hypothetical protein
MEIVALVVLGILIVRLARRRDRAGTGFVLLLLTLWVVGELLGGVFGMLVLATEPSRQAALTFGSLHFGDWLLVYALALGGGVAGSGLAFLAAAYLPALERLAQGWSRFWFTPRDPTLLGLIRIGCGLITLYAVVMYSFELQSFFGEHAWISREGRLDFVHDDPVALEPLFPKELRFVEPQNEKEKEYVQRYLKDWGGNPPPPYPKSNEEAAAYDKAHRAWGVDPRMVGLPAPMKDWQIEYVKHYFQTWAGWPPPPYPRDQAEADEFDAYHDQWGYDPRSLYTKGTRVASVWFDITDPTWMAVFHGGVIAVTFLFVIGFCTRVTSVLTWAGMLSYIQRAPTTLFGMDTMMNILLIYLMIGPSGAALSVDRLLARWWAGGRVRVIGRWRAFWARLLGRPGPVAAVAPGSPPPDRPVPSVSANVAIRLLQIHLCIIYLVAGLAKLRGNTWWNGTAVWWTLANFEFAPMQHSWYMAALRALSKNILLLQVFLTVGTFFTLFFEIGYTFLIWVRTRWLMLSMAIMLHGVIGLFMGLKTFALIMLVMNMGFLTTAEAYWLARPLRWLGGLLVAGPAPPLPSPPLPEPKSVALRADKEPAGVGPGHIKRRK